MKEYQNQNIKAMLALQEMKNQGQNDLQKQAYEQRLSLLGYSAPSANNAQKIDFTTQSTNTESPSNTEVGTTTETFSAPSNNDAATTTDVRGIENINRPEFNPDPETKKRPAWMNGAVPTPFRQASNIQADLPQDSGPDYTKPITDIDSEESLPGYSAFCPTSIGLPYEETEDFIRGEPKRTAMRLRDDASGSNIPIPPPMPERLLEPGTSAGTFERNSPSRQPFRARASKATPNSGPAQTSAEPSQLPYDFLRFDPMRMGKRDFTGSQYAQQQFNRSDPARQGQRSFPTSAYGPQQFDRNDPLRQATRTPTQSFPPQQFNRNDPGRIARRDFAGLPFGNNTLTQPQAGQISTSTTERLI